MKGGTAYALSRPYFMMSHVLKDKLSDPRVRCANTEHVLSTVDRMLAAGSNKLQVNMALYYIAA